MVDSNINSRWTRSENIENYGIMGKHSRILEETLVEGSQSYIQRNIHLTLTLIYNHSIATVPILKGAAHAISVLL